MYEGGGPELVEAYPEQSGAKSKGAGVGSFLHHTSEEGIKKERIWEID